MILEKVTPGLRGEMSRWMLEPKAGVFVGKMSAMVRDRIWQRAEESAGGGAGILIHSSNTEQGFNVRTFGDSRREMVNIEGLWLVRIPAERSK
jgi:CRISPR-associated protein Cas2